jgi:hypothetical protein
MNAPEPKRIYNWQNTQLSIARHYGGCTFNGVEYTIRYDLEGQPLEEFVVKPRKKRIKKEPTNEHNSRNDLYVRAV